MKDNLPRIDIMKMSANIFELYFNQSWNSLHETQPYKIQKVKKNFAKSVSYDIFIEALSAFSNYGRQPNLTTIVSDIVNYVFHYHYFLTSHLDDSTRSDCQKRDDYKQYIKTHIVNVLLKEEFSLRPIPIATTYEPEIYTCQFLCDCFIKQIEQLSKHFDEKDMCFATLYHLFYQAFISIKSILTQLTQGFPSEAVLHWRVCFEIEYKILVLIKHRGNTSDLIEQFLNFSQFNFLDESENDQKWTEYEAIAKKFDYPPYHIGFRNYGWVLLIDQKLKPSIKTLLELAKYDDYDHCERYRYYQAASKFSHANIYALTIPSSETYAFIMRNLYISIKNLKYALMEFLNQYNIPLEDSQQRELESLFEEYVKTYMIFEENCKSKPDTTD